jgi:superfamily I DNA/RNA helicase
LHDWTERCHGIHRNPHSEERLSRVSLVTGAAGYGKTKWLLDQVETLAAEIGEAPHRRLLALSRMHGARRRLDAALGTQYPRVVRTVTTMDSFALGLVNRWRRSLGASRPFVIGGNDGIEDLFGIETSFERVLERALDLLGSATVRTFLGSTYPFILIDEFQDSHGRQLELVQALARSSSLLLAADDFQLLDTDVVGCPAIEWVVGFEGDAEVIELTDCHRTTDRRLRNATQALRRDECVQEVTIPVIACPGHGHAAYRIIERLVYGSGGPVWKGTCAVITPTHDDWIGQVLASCSKQLEDKGRSPIHWFPEISEEQDRRRLLELLDVADESRSSEAWPRPATTGEPLMKETLRHIDHVSRVRGLPEISRGAVAHLTRSFLHAVRTRGHQTPKRVVTTIHGAKNREFDHVFVLWPYNIPSDYELTRRLLYNAVSRARVSAMILARGDEARCAKGVLRLLGPAQPAFPGGDRGRRKVKAKRRA